VKSAIEATGYAVVLFGAVAVALGAWAWWRGEPGRAFWGVARLTQAATLALAALAGVAAASGRSPDSGLFWVYAIVPVVVGVVAEQLRIASAEAILGARGLPDAQAVGALPPDEQRAIARAVLERELLVTLAALAVAVFLVLRALGTDAGL
jgi:hypothetical protein